MYISVQPVASKGYTQNSAFRKDETVQESKNISPKAVFTFLAAAGAAAAILISAKKKKTPVEQIKKITGKNPPVETLTTEEKEKLIKELQTKTDNPEVKAEIRKLIENGEWDKL